MMRPRSIMIIDALHWDLLLGERWYNLRAWTVGSYGFGAFETKASAGRLIPPAKPLKESYNNSAKNVDARYPPNTYLAGDTCYELHKPHQRPPNCTPGNMR